MSVDQRTGVLYAAQEDGGLWRLQLPIGSGEPALVDRVCDFGVHDAYDPESEECAPIDPSDAGFGGTALEADAEGIDVYYGPGATGYVIEPDTGPEVDDERDATNFSYVSWGDVADALGLKADTSARNDPRFR